MLSILIALAAVADPTPLPMQWAQFSRSPPHILIRGISETVDIATGTQKNSADLPYRLRLTTRTFGGRTVKVEWADSVRCPAVRAVVLSMTEIKMPSPAPYGSPGKSDVIMSDGTEYFLNAPSSDNMGSITIASYGGSPLAAWIDSSLKQLASCWSAAL